ncbi:NAD(P) transhydrogenase subunit alpha [Planctomycetota bacterium]|nr:NAD(P) transhydrogenase subunit alpha [Planctomycetota bacterium]
MTFTVLIGFYTFVLACFAGFQLITKVPPTLHTPLMSGANAISGITILGALQLANMTQGNVASQSIALAALIFATVNVVGGFKVTDRMLEMFKKKKKG